MTDHIVVGIILSAVFAVVAICTRQGRGSFVLMFASVLTAILTAAVFFNGIAT